MRGCLFAAGGAVLGAAAAMLVTFLAALWIFTPPEAGGSHYSGHAAAGAVAMGFGGLAAIPGAVIGGALGGWISIRRSRRG